MLHCEQVSLLSVGVPLEKYCMSHTHARIRADFSLQLQCDSDSLETLSRLRCVCFVHPAHPSLKHREHPRMSIGGRATPLCSVQGFSLTARTPGFLLFSTTSLFNTFTLLRQTLISLCIHEVNTKEHLVASVSHIINSSHYLLLC